MKRVAIIGGGIAGLTAAHHLHEKTKTTGAIQLTLFEASAQLGGIIRTTQRDGYLLEHGSDSFLTEKPEVLRLATQLGLEDRLQQTSNKNRRSLIVRHGRLVPVPIGFHLIAPSRLWPFINSEIVSWPAKARMVLDLVLPRGHKNGDADESLADFVRRRLGHEALHRVAQPMIGGIYTANPETLSLRATMPRFIEMEKEHGSVIRGLRKRSTAPHNETSQGARYGLFASFDRGMEVLVDALTARLAAINIRLNTKVQSVINDRNQQWLVSTDGATESFDAVCIAAPAYSAASLLRESDLSDELSSIDYASAATINLAYRRQDITHPLDAFGFVVPFIEKRSLIACTFSSVKFENRAPHNHVLLRAFAGGALQPEVLELDDEEMLARVQADLRELLGVKSAPLFAEISRWRRSMPQYEVGHLARLEKISTALSSHRGLALAGNAYLGVGLPDCIRSGEAAGDAILQSFALGK